MAIYGSLGEVDLNALSASIADTAVDIFVYDTRKDSDGGAWRKRTKHTSWYNETLNTATRGSRREFPAVAVIVLGSDFITIYDGDDPDMPMWMKFISNTTSGNSGGSHFVWSPCTLSSIVCKNGLMGWSDNGSAAGWYEANFISEKVIRRESGSLFARWAGNFAQRNGGSIFLTASSLDVGGIVNWYVNDSAITVLPNAPIDPSTGLPVPTIAVATDGGVSVIKDDGNVYDFTNATVPNTNFVNFFKDKISFGADDGPAAKWVQFLDIPTADVAYTFNTSTTNWYNNYYGIGSSSDTIVCTPAFTVNANLRAHLVDSKNNLAYFGSDYGLGVRATLEESAPRMLSYVTSSWTSGYVVGKIKGAFLSDTDTTNVTAGSNYVTNGTFDTDSDWIKYNNTTVWTISGGTASMSATASYLPLYQYNLGLTTGKRYVASVDVTAISGQLKFDTARSDGSSIDGAAGVIITTTGTHTFTFTAQSDQDGIGIARDASINSSCTIDNISIYELQEQDRSVNNNGLQVFGTVTKSAVATGAELVAYSGFSGSNYLQQPVNSDFEFGTGDWAFYGWHNNPTSASGSGTMFEIGRDTSSGDHIGMRYDGNNYELFISDDSFSSQDVAEYAETPNGEWKFVCGLRRGSQIEIYSDGVLKTTTNIVNATNDLGDNQSYLRFGNRTYINQPWDGSLALWRVSKTAPSPEQIRKIYEDERVLFQENAACTLYGSSDAVTALAYDEDLQLLHVGTSSGRSDFQGLRRINNTTTAVTTAISASNGLVAEQ